MLAGLGSPAMVARGLRSSVFQTESSQRERRARGTRPGLGHGRRIALATAPRLTAEGFSGERGRGAWRPRFARELDGKRAGRERKLTTALIQSENGSGWRLRAAAENSGDDSLCARGWEQSRGVRGGKWGERFARGGVLQATEARGKEGIVGAGALAWVVSNRERETRGRGRLEEGGGPDGWAPPVSRQRERGGREGSQLGQAQEGGRGMRCFGPKWPKRGKERKVSPFYFPNKFSKLFSK